MRRLRPFLGLIILGLLWPGTASATFPGRDGLLAVQPRIGPGIALAQPNGTLVGRICVAATACALFDSAAARWAPDGRELALSETNPARTGPGTIIVYPDGSCLDCDIITGRHSVFTPIPGVLSVIAGGRLMAYGVDGMQEPTVAETGVRAVTWSAGGDLALVDGATVWAGPPGQLRRVGRGSEPSWAPDGRHLAFVRRGWIVVARLGRRGLRRLVRGSSPAWSPDAREVAFIARGGRVKTIPARGGRARRVGDLRGRSIDWQARPRTPSPACIPPPGSKVVAQSQAGIVTTRGTTAPFSFDGPAAYL